MMESRAAVLASLLPTDADHEKFLHLLGIHGPFMAESCFRSRTYRYDADAVETAASPGGCAAMTARNASP